MPGPSLQSRQAVFRLALLLLVLAAMLALLFLAGSPRDMLALLQSGRSELALWIDGNRGLAAIAYALFYMATVTIALPGALWFTIGAGFLFGTWLAIPVSLFGITLGAFNAFLLTRYIAGERARDRFGPRVTAYAALFERNDFTAMILLRVLPLPFFLVNVAAALLGARARPYVAGTLIGSTPSVVLYAGIGAGLATLLEPAGPPGLGALLDPAFLLAAAMVLPLALAPLVWRRWLAPDGKTRTAKRLPDS